MSPAPRPAPVPRVCVGVHAAGGRKLVRATLASLRAGTVPLADVVLLHEQGPAAAFNTLLRVSRAEVLVFLESGARVGPGWLEQLLAALAADPSHGLAGPSTNGVGAQAILRDDDATVDVASAAAYAARRFRSRRRAAAPVPALAGFCLALHRDVAETLGAADERYGEGGGWAADYCARAARAGIAGVWARRSFVSRPPANRRPSVEPWPKARVRIPLPRASGIPSPRPLQRGLPLVSCLMPTRERPDFALQAVRYFLRQDYPNRELVVVDDGAEGLEALLPADRRLRYVRLGERASLGAKLNRACELARGAILAHWDDDDWHHPARLRTEVQPLLAGTADVVALTSISFLDLERWEFWACTPELYGRLCLEGVCGGTRVYRRDVWEHLARYPDRSLAEDAAFLERTLRNGGRLAKLGDEGLYLYVRHPGNTWAFACGRHLDPRGWRRLEEPPLPAADRAFYASRSPAAPPGRPTVRRARRNRPLVSCIMPTRDRKAYVAQAVRYFLRQDYPNRELVVVDDGAEPVAHLLPEDPRVRYRRLERPLVLGEKRNLACELARGTIVVHWDDDDWSAPHRLSYQVAELERSEAAVCGTRRELFYDPRSRQAWLFEFPERRRRRLIGNTLCYRKEAWARRPFPALAVGEDAGFVRAAGGGAALALSDHRICLGLVHAGNTSPKRTGDPAWRPHPRREIERLLGADLGFYERLGDGRY